MLLLNETFDPSSISEEAVAEWVRCASGPGRLRGIFEVYRAHFINAKQTIEWAQEKLSIPVLAGSSQYFMKEEPLRQMQNVAKNVEYVELERCGHSMALEQREKLVTALLKFFQD